MKNNTEKMDERDFTLCFPKWVQLFTWAIFALMFGVYVAAGVEIFTQPPGDVLLMVVGFPVFVVLPVFLIYFSINASVRVDDKCIYGKTLSRKEKTVAFKSIDKAVIFRGGKSGGGMKIYAGSEVVLTVNVVYTKYGLLLKRLREENILIIDEWTGAPSKF